LPALPRLGRPSGGRIPTFGSYGKMELDIDAAPKRREFGFPIVAEMMAGLLT
jgi:hypothetical protein